MNLSSDCIMQGNENCGVGQPLELGTVSKLNTMLAPGKSLAVTVDSGQQHLSVLQPPLTPVS